MTATYAGLPVGAEVLPGFRVVSLLAHGRRMDTYDAYDADRACRVVVKVLRPDRLDDEEVRAAVLQEGAIVTSLAHPHLVRGYAVHQDPPAMVLETLTGTTLSRLEDDGPLGTADVALLATQLASVLGYLHRHEWLHLDVKADNVVVRGGTAVLIDLSLAERPGDGRRGAGTRGYAAPEQRTGRALSPATDVWGLGTTLLEALVGELPFGDGGYRRSPVLPRPSRRPYGGRALAMVPPAWREVLLACLDPDPAGRPRLTEMSDLLSPR